MGHVPVRGLRHFRYADYSMLCKMWRAATGLGDRPAPILVHHPSRRARLAQPSMTSSPPFQHMLSLHRLAYLALTACGALACLTPPALAQVATPYISSYMPGRYNWAFRRAYPAVERLSNGVDYSQARLFETLSSASVVPVGRLETAEFVRTTQEVLRDPPRLPVATAAVSSGFARLVPEVQAMLDWAGTLHRQLYDVAADESASQAERDGRIVELLGYYRSRPDLAISSRPKSMDLPDGQLYSLAFRQRFPKYNGLVWTQQWLQLGLLEALGSASSAADRKAQVDATVARFWQMTRGGAPESMPHLRPMTAAVAPEFARRYPEVGTVLDNVQLLQDVVADILTSREIPRSAKRQEILRAAELFRSDTAFAVSYDASRRIVETIGANNMGGAAVGFTADLPRPTVPRGMSLAGMEGAATDTSIAGVAEVPGMDGMAGMAVMQGSGLSPQQLEAVFQRMMADPVIRERVATDPVLQKMLSGRAQGRQHGNMPGMQGGMAGMQHGNMPMGPGGMIMGASPAGSQPMTGERRQQIDFMMRLLADPTVEAKIRANPELQALWADPEVQRRLAELRRAQMAKPTTTPTPQQAPKAAPTTAKPAPPPPAHQHKP